MLVCVLAWDPWLSAVKGVVGRGREAGGSGSLVVVVVASASL